MKDQTELEQLRERCARLEAALTPSAETEDEYSGEFVTEYYDINWDGSIVSWNETVPWITIKEIMTAILEKAKQ